MGEEKDDFDGVESKADDQSEILTTGDKLESLSSTNFGRSLFRTIKSDVSVLLPKTHSKTLTRTYDSSVSMIDNLFALVFDGDASGVREFLKCYSLDPMDSTCRDAKGCSVYHAACGRGHAETIKVLFTHTLQVYDCFIFNLNIVV